MLHHQKLHPQSGHSGPTDKAFVCEICGKAFRFRSNLAEHRSVHTAVKPFVCKFCGKSSRLKGNLTKHILKHHKTEQKDYIGTDDYIIKKGKKSVKDPAAIDFIEKSMIVLNSQQPSTVDDNDSIDGMEDGDSIKRENLDLDADNNQQPCLLFSLGLDAGSIDLKAESTPPESSGLANMEFLFRSSTNDHLLEKCNAAMEVEDFSNLDNDDRVETPRTSSSAAHSLNEMTLNSSALAQSINLPASSAAALAAAACKALLMGQQNSVERQQNFGGGSRFKTTTRGSFGAGSSQNAGSDVDGELGPLIMATDSTEEDDNVDNDRISCLDFLRNQQMASSNDISTPKSSTSHQNGSITGGSPSSTKCPECGKHLRKPRDLIAHLATIHKVPPIQRIQQQHVNASSSLSDISHQNGDSPPVQEMPSVKVNLNRQQPRQSDDHLQVQSSSANETGNISQELRQIKTSLSELKGQVNTQKVEQLMVNLDSRVGRLEKQLEMALNSIYTLVQLHVQQQRR